MSKSRPDPFFTRIIDAYIYDDAVWREIAENTKLVEAASDVMSEVGLRIDRVRGFMKYLARIEERWVVECKRRGLETSWGQQILATQIMPALEKDFERTTASAKRAARREAERKTQG